jgi:hypothetical protein
MMQLPELGNPTITGKCFEKKATSCQLLHNNVGLVLQMMKKFHVFLHSQCINQGWVCCSYHGRASQIHYNMQMHQTHLDNHGPSTTYTTDGSIHMAGDEPDRDAPSLVTCRSPDHPDGPRRINQSSVP